MIERSFDAVLDRIGATALLIVVALALMLPGFTTLPPMDRDEPRFAQASKQMLDSGDFVDIRFGAEARNKKPVAIYWMQAAAVRFGQWVGVRDAARTIWLYRLPSLFGALASVLLTFWAAKSFVSRRGAVLAAMLTAATPLLGVEARLATTDAVLTATIVAAMGVLTRLYLDVLPQRRDDLGRVVGFWIALAIGILVKGPLTPLIVAAAALVLTVKLGSARWLLALRPLPGLLLCLALVLPWFILIVLRTNGAFLTEAVGHDLLGKVTGGQELHGAPPGTYFAAFWLAGWPIAPFLVLAAPALWRHRGDERILALLAWIVPAWLVFECVPTKLVHYILPLFPALAILAVFGLERAGREGRLGRPAAAWLTFGLLALVPLVVLATLFGANERLWTLEPRLAVLGVFATLLSLFIAFTACTLIAPRTAIVAGLVAALAPLPLYGYLYGLVLTADVAPNLAVSPRLAMAARAVLGPDCTAPGYATVGDREPSLMFETDSALLMTDAKGAAAFLGQGACRVAFVVKGEEAAFNAALDPTLPIILASRVGGLAINGGKALDIGVYIRQ